jgi:hypothetical protein
MRSKPRSIENNLQPQILRDRRNGWRGGRLTATWG